MSCLSYRTSYFFSGGLRCPCSSRQCLRSDCWHLRLRKLKHGIFEWYIFGLMPWYYASYACFVLFLAGYMTFLLVYSISESDCWHIYDHIHWTVAFSINSWVIWLEDYTYVSFCKPISESRRLTQDEYLNKKKNRGTSQSLLAQAESPLRRAGTLACGWRDAGMHVVWRSGINSDISDTMVRGLSISTSRQPM